jgi:hypothetical protein
MRRLAPCGSPDLDADGDPDGHGNPDGHPYPDLNGANADRRDADRDGTDAHADFHTGRARHGRRVDHDRDPW